MTLSELKTIILENKKIPIDSYSLNGGFPNESLCITLEGDKWEVYYSERGKKTQLTFFETETEACEQFYARLQKMLGIEIVRIGANQKNSDT